MTEKTKAVHYVCAPQTTRDSISTAENRYTAFD